MRVSFTGTRRGMGAWQRQQLEKWLQDNRHKLAVFSHGCCSGADIEAHCLVRRVCGPGTYIAVFPSTAKTRAQVPSDTNYVADPKPPLDRDQDIVDCGSDLLIAAPLQMHEVVRSGTWHTVRYARKRKIPVLILWRE